MPGEAVERSACTSREWKAVGRNSGPVCAVSHRGSLPGAFRIHFDYILLHFDVQVKRRQAICNNIH